MTHGLRYPALTSPEFAAENVEGTLSQRDFSDIYFETLQTLPPFRWIFYETESLHKPNDVSDLMEIYSSILNDV